MCLFGVVMAWRKKTDPEYICPIFDGPVASNRKQQGKSGGVQDGCDRLHSPKAASM